MCGFDDAGIGGDEILIEKEYNQSVTSPSMAVIEAIASVEDTDPVCLSTFEGTTLYDYVDTDALDRLLTDGGVDDLSITLTTDEYTVWMEEDRIIVAHTASTPSGLE